MRCWLRHAPFSTLSAAFMPRRCHALRRYCYAAYVTMMLTPPFSPGCHAAIFHLFSDDAAATPLLPPLFITLRHWLPPTVTPLRRFLRRFATRRHCHYVTMLAIDALMPPLWLSRLPCLLPPLYCRRCHCRRYIRREPCRHTLMPTRCCRLICRRSAADERGYAMPL